ncbi:hypothetical protein C8Q73DRAFT_714237 [Cubamyces lactineus]|nr:hypothetical protein C8Q73DRAFT_714237 [Cubamyces lactineus]
MLVHHTDPSSSASRHHQPLAPLPCMQQDAPAVFAGRSSAGCIKLVSRRRPLAVLHSVKIHCMRAYIVQEDAHSTNHASPHER